MKLNHLYLGDNLEVIKTFPDNSIDAIITDSPYGLGKEPDAIKCLQDWIDHGYHDIKGKGFMGKTWDAFVPQPVLWKECFRVLKPGGHPEWYIQGDALEVIYSQNWDMLLGHPPCTYLSYAATGSWNNPGRLEKRLEALNFFAKMWLAPIHFICLENPKSCASPTIAKYSQEIHPYYFGDPELKTTWLWLKNLPLLKDTNRLEKPKPKMIIKNGKKIYWSDSFSLSKDRGHLRSKTFPGIASAMADQWTDYYLKTVCEL